MNNSKKILLLGATISTVILTSCGGNKETETPAADTTAGAAAPAPASTVDEMVDFKFHYLCSSVST